MTRRTHMCERREERDRRVGDGKRETDVWETHTCERWEERQTSKRTCHGQRDTDKTRKRHRKKMS